LVVEPEAKRVLEPIRELLRAALEHVDDVARSSSTARAATSAGCFTTELRLDVFERGSQEFANRFQNTFGFRLTTNGYR